MSRYGKANSREMIGTFSQRVDTHSAKCLELEKEVATLQMQLEAFNVSRAGDPQNHAAEAATRTRFHIRGLPQNCDKDMLRAQFREYGNIQSDGVDIVAERHCGYINFDGATSLEALSSPIMMSGMQLEVNKCEPQADAPEVNFGNKAADDNERINVAKTLASKGFTVKWLLSFWREFGERPQILQGYWAGRKDGSDSNFLTPAEGTWEGRITRASTTNDVVRTIVIPDTAAKQCCYMDQTPNTAIIPGKLVSHWWGASFLGDVKCIIQDATGLTGDSLDWYLDYDYCPSLQSQSEIEALELSYWMCIFAVNQHVSICGMCNDCNVVSTGPTCRICHLDLYNPCSCGIKKYKTGHVLCQMDKFDIVMAQMEKGLAVALDVRVKTLERVWVLSEIGKALEMERHQKEDVISWLMPNDIDAEFCGREDVPIPSIQDCRASLPADKHRILQQIRDTIGIADFDKRVTDRVLPILRRFALVKVVTSPDSDNDVALVLNRHGDPNSESSLGRSVLFEAARIGKPRVVTQLLGAKANVDKQDYAGDTPLYMAAVNNHIEVVNALITGKADVDRANNQGGTPLFFAAQEGNIDVLQCLITARATVDTPKDDGGTPLNMAAQEGFIDVVQALIAGRADVDRASNAGVTPLFMSSNQGHVEVMQQLTAARADVDQPDNQGVTPLHTAAQSNHIEVVQALIDGHADVDHARHDGFTTLVLAAQNNQFDVLRCLISGRATLDKPNNEGVSPTFMGAQLGHSTVIQVLLAAKADCNKPMSIASRHSPLTIAAYMGHSEVCRLLLSAGAASTYQALPKEDEPFMTRGGVAADIAKEQGHAAVIQCLQDNV